MVPCRWLGGRLDRSVRLSLLSFLLLASACSRGMSVPEDSSVGFPDGTTMSDVGADGRVDTGFVRPDAMPPMDSSLPDGGPGRDCVPEVCDNEVDDDCDMHVDEACPCVPGEVSACFSGVPSGRGVGVCQDGMMVCTGSFEFGTYGPCEGDVVDSMEICDVEGLDEDCDGAINEDCECFDGDPPLPCGSDEGECVAGMQRCVDGRRTACEGAVAPAVESCNARDDDCDGSVDEGLTRRCGMDVGECRAGLATCVDGAWAACAGEVGPADEDCNGRDDDCDGATDELPPRACGSDIGACSAGSQVCSSGSWEMCTGAVAPMMESCNGADDDCDGTVDDGLTRSCGTTDVGACAFGTESCVGGAYGACMGAIAPGTELCEGSVDEDCDGTVDEGCGCVSGTTRACGSAVGACMEGSQLCTAGAWGTCTGETGPSMELCDGTVDQDCDGAVDEGCACIDGATRTCGSDVGACAFGMETCDLSGSWGACAGGTGPSTEVCNGVDDDCDGTPDEGGVCLPPTATCPASQSTTVGSAVTLGGGGMDPDGGAVSYAWTVVTAPVGSTAAPSPADAATTTFDPDAAGSYTLRLCVTDDEGVTSCCTAMVTATSACSPPTAPVLTTCPTSWDRRPVVQFDPLPSGMTYTLYADGSPYATISTAGQNYHRPPSDLGAGAPPPGAATTIYARACLTADPTCCATSATVTTSLVESCTTPVAPTPSNLIFSEYVINGDGRCPGPNCEAGEAFEITNLSHCPVALNGHHFSYCNASCTTFRWMDFGPSDIVPPRGVYVAIRNISGSSCSYPFLGADDPGLFGLKTSSLVMMSTAGDTSGWFVNSGGSSTTLRIATGPFVDMTTGTTIDIISPYSGAAGECQSIGFDAYGACGSVSPVATPTDVLDPNQLGRLWEPCDTLTSPVPASCM